MKDIKAKKLTVTQEELNRMFDQHMKLVMQYRNAVRGSKEETWTSAKIQENQKWFAIFGVDVSYETVQRYLEESND